jgi:hypothetical protein
MALSTIGTAGIADDAITAAKIDDDGAGFVFGDVTTGALTATGATTGIVTFDKLKLDGSSVATVTVNSAVSASATIVVDGVSGTIAVGMVVNVSDTTVRSITDAASQSAISVDDTLTITAVASQTSFTVSEAVTIADNVVLILTADENQGFVLDASAASTDVGDEILFEDATSDGSTLLNSGGGTGTPPIVLQVKQVVIPRGTITTSSASFVSIGHSLAITPSATSSRILIQVCGGAGHCPYVNQFCISTIYRGSTNLSTNGLETIGNSSAGLSVSSHNIVFLDSPSTTSEVTYTPYYRSQPTQPDCYWNLTGPDGADATMTLTEIAG